MRVLHVIARLNVGGTARYITQLAMNYPSTALKPLLQLVLCKVQNAKMNLPNQLI
jgi:hypothetical protein